MAVGWGTLSEGGSLPMYLQQVNVQTIDYQASACKSILIDRQKQLCAGVSGGGKGNFHSFSFFILAIVFFRRFLSRRFRRSSYDVYNKQSMGVGWFDQLWLWMCTSKLYGSLYSCSCLSRLDKRYDE